MILLLLQKARILALTTQGVLLLWWLAGFPDKWKFITLPKNWLFWWSIWRFETIFPRALSKFEFEDVRKLAAELCGRLHPKVATTSLFNQQRIGVFLHTPINLILLVFLLLMQVLIPILSSQLESAASAKDLLKIKVCLFSLCTCLMVGSSPYKSIFLCASKTMGLH